MPALTTEVFGARHFCANQTMPQAATSVGALLLANQLAGRIYQAHVPPSEPACYGRYCFRWASSNRVRAIVNSLLDEGAAQILDPMSTEWCSPDGAQSSE